MEIIKEPLAVADAVGLLERAMEQFRRGERAEARDLFFGVREATEGELARFAGEAARWLDAGDGSVPNGAALETAFAALKASFTAEAPIALRRL